MNTDRKKTTEFLGSLLIAEKFVGAGKYWAREVSIDPFTTHGRRIDFMQFVPPSQCSISGIEKGIFVCYEIKSCKEDIFSGNGLDFFGEKNYIVTTMQCWKDLIKDDWNYKIREFLHEKFPQSSDYFGVMIACPSHLKPEEDFDDPTPLPADGDLHGWSLRTIAPCREGLRNKSMNELLFCMLRSGK